MSHREWYWFDKMNDMLAGALTFDDPDSVAAARALVNRVVTCEDARLFTRRRNEHSRAQPLPPESLDAENAPIDNEEFVDEPASKRVDKVADGFEFFSPVTVRLESHGCSGVLIGARTMLTAAHCFPSNSSPGAVHIRVSYGTTHPDCINANCGGTSDNAYVWPYPGYTGTGDAPHDMAVIDSYQPWLAPANVSTSWARILKRMTVVGEQFFVEGYGDAANTPAGAGFGVGRSGNLFETVGANGPSDWFMNVTPGRGRPCAGDSGSPANNDFNLLGKPSTGFSPCIFGVNSYGESPTSCGDPGDREYYSRLSDKIWLIEAMHPGGCYHGSSNNNPYIRCW